MKKHCIVFTIILIISFSFTKICAQLQFTSHTISGGTLGTDGAIAVYAIDMDDDGDIDILSASWNDDKITWYENLGPVGFINDNLATIAIKPILYDNYPNPFNPETTLEFDVSENSHVILKMYDLHGREVTTLVNKRLPAGHYERTFNAKDFASGIYFYEIRIGDFHAVKKMMLIK